MVTYYVSSDCVAAVLENEEMMNNNCIREAVSACLHAAGCRPWPDMEAELYYLDGQCLLIARPSPPLRQRLKGHFPRLTRI